MITNIDEFLPKALNKVEIERLKGKKFYYFMGLEFGERRNTSVAAFKQFFESRGYIFEDASGKGCKNCGRADLIISW